jgi:glycosyltransferase involved in cell wall biosynthesis
MDGIEWKRERWGMPKRAAFYLNERIACMVGDHLIADHPVIADHLATRTRATRITTIAYGAPAVVTAPEEPVRALGLHPGGYSTVICRPEAENSLLEIVTAFSQRTREHKLVVLGEFDETDAYHRRVMDAASPEVVFPGVVYDPASLSSLRLHSRLYVHGHTVGGTNPSLVEALGAGNPVVAHDNPYNRWVAGPEQRYFTSTADLADIFDDLLADARALQQMASCARARHAEAFTWPIIAARYEDLLTRYLPPDA